MISELDLLLVHMRGVPARALPAYRRLLLSEGLDPRRLSRRAHVRLWRAIGEPGAAPEPSLPAGGTGARSGPLGDARPGLADEAAELAASGAGIIWRGERGYPESLERGLGDRAPAWIFVRGSAARLTAPSVAIIGSRETPAPLRAAAFVLAEALASRGRAVVSGMARGADYAAHLGAARAPAGTVAWPARGILPALREAPAGRVTLAAIGRPREPFGAGLAIRRNHCVAASAEAVVLVATGLGGGSSYAVRWALEAGRPVLAFDSGADTPPGNAHLIRAGLAAPLRAGEPAERLAERIERAIAESVAGSAATPRPRRGEAFQTCLFEAALARTG